MNVKNRIAVVGVDLGCTGDDALMEGLRLLAVGALSKLHLLYVVDPRAVTEAAYGLYESEERALASAPKRAEQHALSLCHVFKLDVDRSRFVGHARIGDPATALLQMCADYDADVLIVGTHGRTGVDRLLDGSVAESVARRAHCPVLIARRKNYSGVSRTALPDLPYAAGEEPLRSAAPPTHVQSSTTIGSWQPSDNGPTGFRIV